MSNTLLIDVRGKYEQEGRDWFERDEADILYLTSHHTASHPNLTGEETEAQEKDILKQLMATHANHGWVGLSYHIVIFPSGRAYWVNDFSKVTWHDTHNWDSIGISFVGYFHQPHNNKPSVKALEKYKAILDWLCTENPQFPADHDDVLAHRERHATACNGEHLYPYTKENKTKLGNVDWAGESSSNAGFLDQDINTDVEERFSLKTYDFYSKYWTFAEFIEDSIATHLSLDIQKEKNKDLITSHKQDIATEIKKRTTLEVAHQQEIEQLKEGYKQDLEDKQEQWDIERKEILNSKSYKVGEALVLFFKAIGNSFKRDGGDTK